MREISKKMRLKRGKGEVLRKKKERESFGESINDEGDR